MNHDNDNLADAEDLADDVLKGAAAISKFMNEDTRSVFYMISKGRLPVYRIGESMRARKSTLRAWIANPDAATRAA